MLRNHIVFYIVKNMLEVQKDLFKLKEKFTCTNLNSDKVEASVWAIEGQIGSEKFYSLLCEIDKVRDFSEYILLSKLEDSPTYGSYLCIEDDEPTQSVLSYSPKESIWLPTNVYLQATYLAGMESLKDVLVEWHALEHPIDFLKELQSFYNATMDNDEEEVFQEDIT